LLRGERGGFWLESRFWINKKMYIYLKKLVGGLKCLPVTVSNASLYHKDFNFSTLY
jgi:hypothetical protein